jgi:hypothetical protein
VSVVYVTFVKTYTTVLLIYSTYDHWLDKSSKLEGYTCGTYTQPQHMLPRAHCANFSKGARCMGLTCIYPVSSTKRTTRVYHYNPEASLAHEMREQPTVSAVTVTSCVGKTSLPLVSPEDILDPPNQFADPNWVMSYPSLIRQRQRQRQLRQSC